MLGRELPPSAGRHTNDQRDAELVARHVADGRRRIENLVEREQAEVHRHQFHNRAHTGHCRPNAGAGKPGFRKWGVADPLGPKLCKQSMADRVTAAISADILTHQKNALVALHRVTKGLSHRLAIRHLFRFGADGFLLHDCHRPVGTARSAYVKRVSCSTGSHVPASAKATAWAISASISVSMRDTSS